MTPRPTVIAGNWKMHLRRAHALAFADALRAHYADPASAESAGINVSAIRYAYVMVGGALAGVGGAYFSLKIVPTWQDDPIGEAGWIAIALVILASWRPGRAVFAAYLCCKACSEVVEGSRKASTKWSRGFRPAPAEGQASLQRPHSMQAAGSKRVWKL